MDINTKIISHEFDYHSPATLEEALGLLGKPGAAALAGGTDLINRLKQNTAKPSDVVYVGGLPELQMVETGNGITFGAMTAMTDIEKIEGMKTGYTCFFDAIHSVGGQQIRNVATVAGNIANASPAADCPVALIALGAWCDLGRLGEDGKVIRRQVPVEEMFTGPGKTVLEQGELILSVHLPAAAAPAGCSFQKNARVKLDVAKASAAAWLCLDGDRCADIRVAAGSVAPVPLRAAHVEAALKGKVMNPENIKTAAAEIGNDIHPITDVRSTDSYRKRIMIVLVRDAIIEAWKQARGGTEK